MTLHLPSFKQANDRAAELLLPYLGPAEIDRTAPRARAQSGPDPDGELLTRYEKVVGADGHTYLVERPAAEV
ncbi:hypothetical protein [Cellulomonas marina]|uniref:Uncharacterized protein n=1 Tax=Cellulomonas marina TaxID=988821 RepID=A0A1I1AVH8_9CELL|nr:hypothetical protein [Cellulomonas marina]GIG30704.1 hypothetical protein Cma02nite_33040 [Cellulomonas marina]SFB42079.1 hypothetical protein SAMN05421867_12413 [Cellulomonas marina]